MQAHDLADGIFIVGTVEERTYFHSYDDMRVQKKRFPLLPILSFGFKTKHGKCKI